MTSRSLIAAALGAAGLAALTAYAPAASADRLAFSVAVGGPGYAFAVGSPGGFYGTYYAPPVAIVAPPPVRVLPPPAPAYRSYYRARSVPVVVPAPVRRPHYHAYYAPVLVAPPLVVRPHPVARPYYGY